MIRAKVPDRFSMIVDGANLAQIARRELFPAISGSRPMDVTEARW